TQVVTTENVVARHERDAPNTGVFSRNHCTHNVRAPERRNRREGGEHEQNERGAHLSLLKRHGPSSFPANGFTRTPVPAPCRRGTYIALRASCQAFFNTKTPGLADGVWQFISLDRAGSRYVWDTRPGYYFVEWRE